jgi:hypothetical protein
MAVDNGVDPTEWIAEQIGACEPDLLRSLRHALRRAGQPPQRVPVPGVGHPRRGRSCGGGRTDHHRWVGSSSGVPEASAPGPQHQPGLAAARRLVLWREEFPSWAAW